MLLENLSNMGIKAIKGWGGGGLLKAILVLVKS